MVPENSLYCHVLSSDVDLDCKTGLICFTQGRNILQEVFNSYNSLDHTEGTFNLHPSRNCLPSNLPASAADGRKLVFNRRLFYRLYLEMSLSWNY
jgi:hypothetical protein